MACPRRSAPERTRQCTGVQRSLQASSSVRSGRSSASLARCERGARHGRCGRLLPVNSLDSALHRRSRASMHTSPVYEHGGMLVCASWRWRCVGRRVGVQVSLPAFAWVVLSRSSDAARGDRGRRTATSTSRRRCTAAAPTKDLRRGAAQDPVGRHRRPGMGDRSPGKLANFVEIMAAPTGPGTPARTLRAETGADAGKGWHGGGGRMSAAMIGQGDPALWCMVGAQVEVVLAAWAGEHGAGEWALNRDRSHGGCGTMPRYDLR